MKDEARGFEAATGIKVEIVDAPVNSSERLVQYLQYMGVGSDAIDVFQIDIIWVGMLEEHLVDLNPDFAAAMKDFVPEFVANNTVRGRLVAIPWFGDIGLLYYRKDLLEKYGYAGPPRTWEELEAAAKKIQDGERAAAPPTTGTQEFWGYLWAGVAREGLVCNGLEWQASEGGGVIVERGGRVSINNPQVVGAFDRAARWVGTISPPSIINYMEDDGRRDFQAGHAAFLRSWTYAYPLLSAPDSPVAGKFGVTAMPSGAERQASTLGGWQLAISSDSTRRPEAVQLVRWLTRASNQRRRSQESGSLPVRLSLLRDSELAAQLPLGDAAEAAMKGAVARPSAVAGARYNEVSAVYTQELHKVLEHKQSGADAARQIAHDLADSLH